MCQIVFARALLVVQRILRESISRGDKDHIHSDDRPKSVVTDVEADKFAEDVSEWLAQGDVFCVMGLEFAKCGGTFRRW